MALTAFDDSVPENVALEDVDCPLGCPRNDQVITSGHDRLHGLPGRFDVVRCKRCGLMRTNPRPNLATMSFYYPENYRPYTITEVGKSGPRRKRRSGFSNWMKADARALPPIVPGRLLELGCASGSFLHEMAQAGWEVEGIEPSAQAARQAREAGYKVQNASLESALEPAEPFDVIVGWMVLEHLHQPLVTLQRLRSWVREDGWLLLSVPDAGSLEFKLFKDRWYALQLPTHLTHFSPSTLTSMLDRADWAVERIVWHRNARNTLLSLSYLAADRDWQGAAGFFREAGERRRLRTFGKAFGILQGLLHQSGRMTVWARPA